MQALPAPSRRVAASLWMRLRVGQFAAVAAILAASSLLVPAPARANTDRPLLAALTIGVRSYTKAQDLGSAAAFGGRLGLGVSDRMSVWLDAVTGNPERRSSGRAAHVSAIRAIVQGRILTGTLRPYVALGGGALIFNYGDAYDSVGGIMNIGAGADWRVAPRTLLFAEAAVDLYRSVEAFRLPTGEEVSSSPGDAQTVTALSAGIAVEF